MALTTKRIIALTTQSDPQEGDYLAIDNATNGTKKIPVGSVGVELDDTLTQSGKAADAKAVGDALDGISSQIEATGDAIDEIRSQIEVTGTASGAIATFADGSDAPMKSCIASIVPKQSGSGTPSPDNVRPISGWESVSVYDTGVNVWDEEWEGGDLSGEGGQPIPSSAYIRSVNFNDCKPNISYYKTSNANVYVFWYDEEKAYISHTNGEANTSIASPQNARYFKVTIKEASYSSRTSINYPATDTDYHAYNGTTTTTPLGRTVYGGTLDVVTGVLTVTHGYVDMGSLNWASYGTGLFYANLTGAKVSEYSTPANAYCSCYEIISMAQTATETGVAINNGQTRANAHDISYADATAFKTAVTGQTLVYELATPQTIQLTPEEIKTLLGENNVWADSGDIEVVYVRDLNIVINSLLNNNGTRSLGMMAMSAPTETTAEEPTDEPAEDDMR